MSYDRYSKTSHKEGFGSSFIVAGSVLKTNDLGGIAHTVSICSAPSCPSL
jgi:hypothetical protein